MVSLGINSIKWKLVLSIGIAAVVVFSAVTGFAVVQESGEVTDLTEQRMEQKAQAHANEINTDMTEYKQMSASLSATMEGYERQTASRAEVSGMLENMAINNPEVLGVYVAYEPDAFDGESDAGGNVTAPGSNDAGRFAPYWSRFSGDLSVSPLNDLDSQDWYTRPIEEQRPVIKGPFVWGGKYMLSFLTPIERNGEVVGVSGVDVSVDYWQNETEQAEVEGDGYSFMIGGDGTLVAHPNETAVGQTTVGELGDRNGARKLSTMQERIRSQDSGNFTMQDPVTGKEALVQYESVETGEFFYATVIPKETALAGVVSTRNNLLAVSGFGLILLVGVVFVGTRRITRPIEALSNKAAAIEEGDYDIDIESDRRDEVGDLYGSLSSMRDSLVSKVQESEEASRRAQSAKEEAETARTEAEQLNKHLQQKASEFSRVMESAADGDLTRRMDPDSESPAMSQIAESYNGMMSDIEEAFAEISSFAEEVDRMTAEVSSSTQEGKEASEQVGSSIQEISADAEKQSESLHQVSSEVQNLSGSIEEVAASADQIAASSQEMAEIGSKSQRSASDAIEEMSAIEEKSDQTIGEMKTLADEIEEIVDIVELINDIAEQTNILALNASIEAARADEAGEGFAVVAEEIKQLAGEVGDATDEVESLIVDIQSSTESAVADIQQMGKRVDSGTDTIEEALGSLDEIAAKIDDVNEGVQQISDATANQASSAEEVASMVGEVTEKSERVSSEAENVSAAAEQQTSSLERVSENSDELAKMSGNLQSMLDRFEVKGKGTDTEPVPTESPPPDEKGATADGGRSDSQKG